MALTLLSENHCPRFRTSYNGLDFRDDNGLLKEKGQEVAKDLLLSLARVSICHRYMYSLGHHTSTLCWTAKSGFPGESCDGILVTLGSCSIRMRENCSDQKYVSGRALLASACHACTRHYTSRLHQYMRLDAAPPLRIPKRYRLPLCHTSQLLTPPIHFSENFGTSTPRGVIMEVSNHLA